MSSTPEEFSPEQLRILDIVNAAGSLLSFAGELFIIGCYFFVPDLRTFPMKLIVSMIFSCLLYTISDVLSYFSVTSDCLCHVEGYLREFARISLVLWIVTITWLSYLQIKKYRPKLHDVYPYLLIGNILLASFPSNLTAYSELQDGSNSIHFGHATNFCAILPIETNIYLVDIPLWTLILITWCYTFKILKKVRLMLDGFSSASDYSSILLYPIILVVCWLPSTLDRVAYFMNDKKPVYSLVLLHIIATRIQGFVNALVYGRNEWHKIKYCYKKWKKMDHSVLSANFLEVNYHRSSGSDLSAKTVSF